MATVLGVTRHSDMSSEHAEALQAAVTKLTGESGPHQVAIHGETVKNASEVMALVEEHGAAVVEVVLPPAILADLTNPRNNPGTPVIRARMERELSEDGTTATFTFDVYERIIKVEVVIEEL